MSDGSVMQIATQAIILATKLAGPFLLVTLAIGLGVGLLQSATQVQEQTIAFVPKLAGVALVMIVAGHWMLAELIGFTRNLFDMIPNLVQ
jgi:flagellar biosynthesis protein FliQ